ncbi:MAG: hypothetical protein GXP25_14830 [Planctomycetes bacterium]|nr:hypothetical protein [Planctomycetota bacterium]
MSRLCKWMCALIVVTFVAAQFGCASSQVIGNKSSKVYHTRDCKCVGKMKEENKVPFASTDAARKEGYRPCKVCLDEKTGAKKATEPKKAK